VVGEKHLWFISKGRIAGKEKKREMLRGPTVEVLVVRLRKLRPSRAQCLGKRIRSTSSSGRTKNTGFDLIGCAKTGSIAWSKRNEYNTKHREREGLGNPP